MRDKHAMPQGTNTATMPRQKDTHDKQMKSTSFFPAEPNKAHIRSYAFVTYYWRHVAGAAVIIVVASAAVSHRRIWFVVFFVWL